MELRECYRSSLIDKINRFNAFWLALSLLIRATFSSYSLVPVDNIAGLFTPQSPHTNESVSLSEYDQSCKTVMFHLLPVSPVRSSPESSVTTLAPVPHF